MLFDPAKQERKKKLNEFFKILSIPLMLALVNTVFFQMALAAFQAKETGQWSLVRVSAVSQNFSASFGFQFCVMMLLAYLWGRPAYQYIKNPVEKLKEKIRRRLGNIYRDGFIMVMIAQGLALALQAAVSGRLSNAEYAAAGVALLAQVALLVAYLDVHLAKQKSLMEALYTPEELVRPRSGFSLPIYVKISTLIIGFAILPFALIYIAFLNRVPWDAFSGQLVFMLFLSSVLLLNGLSAIYNGIQLPLDGLIAKMRRVAGGEFVKTRIYFADEIGNLKGGFNEMVDGLKEREELQDTFGKYLSIEIARELIKNKKVKLGGEDMEAAVMFCDIRNFTPLSEKLAASELVDFLNGYFHYITPPITANKGVINKFMGDAVMAIYTPLLGSSDYAADAVRAAVGMRKALAEFNASGKAPGTVEFGIGIHSGKLVGGNIGTAFRLEYTFIGDTVNIAARLESKTRELNTDILVSGPAVQKASGSLGGAVAFASLGKAALKGKAEAVEIYKVL